MAIGVLSVVIASVLSGCTAQTWGRSMCSSGKDAQTSEAVACVAGSAYLAARKNEKASREEAAVDKSRDKEPAKETDPRYKEWIP
jgi:hypothetical protein